MIDSGNIPGYVPPWISGGGGSSGGSPGGWNWDDPGPFTYATAGSIGNGGGPVQGPGSNVQSQSGGQQSAMSDPPGNDNLRFEISNETAMIAAVVGLAAILIAAR